MKTIVTIVGLTFATLGFAQQAEIVNGFDGFEVWVNAETGELPQYWDGFNKNVEFNGMIVGTTYQHFYYGGSGCTRYSNSR